MLQNTLSIILSLSSSVKEECIELLEVALRLLETDSFKMLVMVEEYRGENHPNAQAAFEDICSDLSTDSAGITKDKILQCLQNSNLVSSNISGNFKSAQLSVSGDLEFISIQNSSVSPTPSVPVIKKQRLEVGEKIISGNADKESVLSHSKSRLFKPSNPEVLETKIHEDEKDEKLMTNKKL